ncbi:galactan 5-O-arabinofuranosyltransferase [Corynebacterium oculi]|uniref:galactan 5-O-arabinofuranosyltransferase n=1 Tax=Corynebacterium oculi TaxID=1544416 RepID=UPI0006D8A499|nr:galactan 5-O-arabinofuranosyltransferase [Corynebacterium oculi]
MSSTDRLGRRGTLLAMALAPVAGAVFTLVLWFLAKQVTLPAFSTSMVTRALATAGSAAVLLVVGVLMAWWLRGGVVPRWRRALTYAAAYVAPAALVFSTTGVPLSATRLYIDGLQVDQAFRTQFLSRMAQTTSLADMNYIDMPTYYPPTWFWLGGRMANLLGMPGWEVYQPWALVSIAAAACLLVPVWQRLVGSLPAATAIALVSTCLMLQLGPQEPYAIIVALGVPALSLVARRALAGSWFATAGVAVFLGVSATMYTLFTALAAGSVVVMALVVAAARRSWRPLLHLVVAGTGSILLALSTWGPYLWAALHSRERSGATAMHYLPGEGAEFPLPFLAASIVGVLCMVGLVYLVLHWRRPAEGALLLVLLCQYAWCLASMVLTIGGVTLLGFRVEMLVALQLATAGVMGFGWLRRQGLGALYPDRFSPQWQRRITVVLVVVLSLAGVKYAQDIPTHHQENLDYAYSDTDGYGERADRFAPNAAQYYGQIDEEIRRHGHDPADTVVLADENRFMSFHPYYGFQAFTSHYANPLGEFDRRNAAIEDWALRSWEELADPAAFDAAVEAESQEGSWRAPDVFIFRGDLEAEEETGAEEAAATSGFKIHLAEDIYPNHPNIRFKGVFFNPASFADASRWATAQIGPFVVVTRVSGGVGHSGAVD